jgi:hypothetical protein
MTFQKGHPPYLLHHTEETKKIISQKLKGKNNSPDTQFKKGHKDLVPSKSRKIAALKISIATRGIKRPQCSGEKANNWKEGITPTNHLIRNSLEMILWREACMKRDKFTCQKTGETGVSLQVHHINNFADFSELRTSVSNGITLSKKSHKEFHKIYGIKKNTRDQLNEFLSKKEPI